MHPSASRRPGSITGSWGIEAMCLARARFVFCVALAASLSAANNAAAQLSPRAAGPAQRDTTTQEYRGAYQRGFEQSWFIPCDAPADDKMWWVTLTDEALHQRDSLLATITAPVTNGLSVRWRATVSARMPSGHMGRGTRYMLVTTILDIRPMPDAVGCGARS